MCCHDIVSDIDVVTSAILLTPLARTAGMEPALQQTARHRARRAAKDWSLLL